MINPATGRERLQKPYAMGRMRRMAKRGISGYDPDYPDMRGVFMARGPGICISLYHPKLLLETFCFAIDKRSSN